MKSIVKVTGLLGVAAISAMAVIVSRAATDGQGIGFLAWSDAETVALGAEVYALHCAACHGVDLEGQRDWQFPLESGRLPAPPHDETGHTWHHPDALLLAITTDGTAAVVGNGYESDMPGFGGILSRAEIIAALSFIKSTWPDEIIAIHDDINARYAPP